MTGCGLAWKLAKCGRLRPERRGSSVLVFSHLPFYHRGSSTSSGGTRMRFRTLVLRGTIAALALLFVAVLVQARFPQPAAEYQGRRAKLRAGGDGPGGVFGYKRRDDA